MLSANGHALVACGHHQSGTWETRIAVIAIACSHPGFLPVETRIPLEGLARGRGASRGPGSQLPHSSFCHVTGQGRRHPIQLLNNSPFHRLMYVPYKECIILCHFKTWFCNCLTYTVEWTSTLYFHVCAGPGYPEEGRQRWRESSTQECCIRLAYSGYSSEVCWVKYFKFLIATGASPCHAILIPYSLPMAFVFWLIQFLLRAKRERTDETFRL